MLRIGVIGGGFGTIGLAPAFRSIAGCEVVQLEHPRGSWQAFLDDGRLDAVAIAVPPSVQYEIASAAVDHGLHVFAEKPLTASVADAASLCALAKERRVVTAVDFMFPDIAQWRAVKGMLDQGVLGVCRHLAVSWTWMSGDIAGGYSTWRTDVREGGGALSHYFSHGLYYLEHFLGPIVRWSGSLRHSVRSSNGGEVGVDLVLGFVSGASASVHVSCDVRGPSSHRLAFECEDGRIVIENRGAVVEGFQVRTFTDAGESALDVPDEPSEAGEDERVKVVRRVAQRFVDACRDGGSTSPCFEDALRVQELIEAIRAEASTSRSRARSLRSTAG